VIEYRSVDFGNIFGGLIGFFILVCLITLLVYWIAFPIIVARYLKPMLQSQQKAEEHLRVLRSAHEEQTKREHAKSSPPPLDARHVVVEQTYHYSAEGEQIGPYTFRDIREFRDAGVIANDTLLLKDGDTQWKPFCEFAEFASLAHGTKET
jgi:hypothetical protein